VSHNKLTLNQRVDRHLLLSLFEQSRQTLQVRVDASGELEDQSAQLPDSHPVLEKAISFMKAIAVQYKDGKVGKSELKDLRDKNLKDLPELSGKTRAKGAARPKPSSSASAADSKSLERATTTSASEPLHKRPAAAAKVKDECADGKAKPVGATDVASTRGAKVKANTGNVKSESDRDESEGCEGEEEEEGEPSESESVVRPSLTPIPVGIEEELLGWSFV
jgi:hypothetical protein